MQPTRFGNTYDRFYVALGLPIKEDCYEIDFEAFRKLVRYFLTDDFVGIGGSMIVLPEAGEIFTLSRDEKQKVIAIAAEENNGKVPMFVGASSNNTRETARDAKMAVDEGATGIFVMPPMGCQDVTLVWDVRKYPEVYINICKSIMEAVDVPLIAHGAGPKDPEYGLSYPIEVLDRLLEEVPNMIGWKMMYNYQALKEVAFHLRDIEKKTGRHLGILPAGAYNFFECLSYDIMDGSVSCFWNYAKEPNIALISAMKAGKFEEAKKLWLDGGLFMLHNMVGRPSSRLHTRFKVASWLRGLYPTPFLRAPMIPPLKEEVVALRQALINANLYVISDEEIQKVYNKLPR